MYKYGFTEINNQAKLINGFCRYPDMWYVHGRLGLF